MSPYQGSLEVMRNTHSFGKDSFSIASSLSWGNSHISLLKARDLFNLEDENFNSNSWKIKIHLEYLPSIIHRVKICCIGFNICNHYRRRSM
jgi:hypothetical protein